MYSLILNSSVAVFSSLSPFPSLSFLLFLSGRISFIWAPNLTADFSICVPHCIVHDAWNEKGKVERTRTHSHTWRRSIQMWRVKSGEKCCRKICRGEIPQHSESQHIRCFTPTLPWIERKCLCACAVNTENIDMRLCWPLTTDDYLNKNGNMCDFSECLCVAWIYISINNIIHDIPLSCIVSHATFISFVQMGNIYR